MKNSNRYSSLKKELTKETEEEEKRVKEH